jgi:hypothetical protein
MNFALDADGHLTYLATSEWRLGFVMEEMGPTLNSARPASTTDTLDGSVYDSGLFEFVDLLLGIRQNLP